MSEKYQCIKTTAKDLKETYKNETMDKIFEDFAEALNDYQDFGCESCKAQDKLKDKIADLEHRLSNCIEPKFKQSQAVFIVFENDYLKGYIDCFDFYTKKYLVHYPDEVLGDDWCSENEIFASKAEVKAKLEELQGE